MKPVQAIALSAVVGSAMFVGLGSVVAEERELTDDTDTHLSAKPDNAYHANDLIGSNVKSTMDDEEIGSVSDLILDEDGSIVAVVVGVGGFLGIGDKDVAISWDSVDLARDAEDDDAVLRVDTDEEALESAPEYEDAGTF